MLKRNSKKIFILSVLIIAIAVIVASLCFTNQIQFNSADINAVSAASNLTVANFNAGLVSDGEGLADGEVASDYEPDTTDYSNYTIVAIDDDDDLQDFLADNTNKYGYLTYDISTTLSVSSTYGNGYTLNGVLDGCGRTISIASDASESDSGKDISYGGLFDSVVSGGVLRNIKIEVSGCYYSASNSETNSNHRVGLIVGNMKGSAENCYVEWSGSGYFLRNKYSGNHHAILGGFCGQLEGGRLTNVTMDFQADFVLQVNGLSGLVKNWNMWLGGVAGEVNAANSSMTNITVTGNNKVIRNYQNGNRGSGYSNSGALIGSTSQSITIDGVKFAGRFTVSSSTGKDNSVGLITGEGNSVTVNNLYYSTNANNWANTFGGNTTSYMSGTVQSSTVSSKKTYSIDDDKIGFCHKATTKIWIGEASECNASSTNTTGSYVRTVTIGGTAVNVESKTAPAGVEEPCVPTVLKSAVDGEISGYSFGYYAFVKNDAKAVSITSPSSTFGSVSKTQTNAFSTEYRGVAATAFTVTEDIYIGGSDVGDKTLTGWAASGDNVNCGTFTISNNPNSTVNFSGRTFSYNSNGTKYGYLLFANSYGVSITITKKTLTLVLSDAEDNSGNTNIIFDGNPHNVGVSYTGLCGQDINANATDPLRSDLLANSGSTYQYSTDGGALQNIVPSQGQTYYEAFAITHVNESVRTVYVSLVFKNYKGSSGDAVSANASITIAQKVNNDAYSNLDLTYDNYVYTGSALVEYSNSTATPTSLGITYFNKVLQHAFGDNTDYSSLFGSLFTLRHYTVSNNQSTVVDGNIVNVGTYAFSIQAQNQSAESDIIMPTNEQFFNYSIVKADVYLEFTPIVGQLISVYGTGNNNENSPQYKTYDSSASELVLVNNGTYYYSGYYYTDSFWINNKTNTQAITVTYSAVYSEAVYNYTAVAQNAAFDANTTYYVGQDLLNAQGNPGTDGVDDTFTIAKDLNGQFVSGVHYYTLTSTSYSSNTSAVNTVTNNNKTSYKFTDAGQYVVTFSFNGNGNLEASSYTYYYQIKKNNNVTFRFTNGSSGSRKYDGTDSYYLDRVVNNNTVNGLLTNAGFNAYLVSDSSAQIAIDEPTQLLTRVVYTDMSNVETVDTDNFTDKSAKDAGVYVITCSVGTNKNYDSPQTATYTYTIEQAEVRVYFNDTKDLYDSILDTTEENSVKYYDFIYVASSDSFTNSNYYFYINKFLENYSKYFVSFAPYGTTPVTSSAVAANAFGNYLTITTNVSTSTTDKTVLRFAWTTAAQNDASIQNNYLDPSASATNVVIATSGSGNSEQSSYCDSAFNNESSSRAASRIRIRVVSEKTLYFTNSVTRTSSSSGDVSGSNGTDMFKDYDGTRTLANSDLYWAMTSHYYDTYTRSQLQNVTSIKIVGRWYIDTNYTGYTIIPSYKVIDGQAPDHTSGANQGQIVYQKQIGRSDKNRQYEQYSISNINEKTNSFVYNRSTSTYVHDNVTTATHALNPAYTTILGEEYYGGGILAGINYGVIKGFNFEFYGSTGSYHNQYLQINGYTNANTALGTVVGINYGIVTDNGFWYERAFKYNAASSSYKFATGQIAGINAGIITGNTNHTWGTALYSDRGWDADEYVSFRFDVTGSASSCYYGFVAGINTGIVSTMTVTDGSDNRNKVPITVIGTWNLYSGAFVGYNKGTITGMSYTMYSTYAVYGMFKDNNINSDYETGLNNNYRGYELYFSATGNTYAGGICGYNANNGTITSSTFIPNSGTFTATATGNTYASSISGYNAGTITGVTFNTSGSGLLTTRATVDAYFGGISGYVDTTGHIVNSTFTHLGSGATSIESANDVYLGGIGGYNKGEISGCTTNLGNSSTARYLTARSTKTEGSVVAGGAVGYNEGTTTGFTLNNYGGIIVGTTAIGTAPDYAIYYALGGIAGVNDGGTISNGKVLNNANGVLYAASSLEKTYNYVGGIVGIGTEAGACTANNGVSNIYYAHKYLKVGTLSNCSIFNYNANGFTATNGYFGLVAGRYNSVLGNGYTHAYSGLIWYTSAIPSGASMTLFDGSTGTSEFSVLGYNGGLANATGCTISGVAGISLSDGGDGSLGANVFQSAVLDINGITINYSSIVDAYSGTSIAKYKKLRALVGDSFGTINSNAATDDMGSYTTNFGANSLTVSAGSANAIISDTSAAPAVAEIILYIEIELSGNGDYCSFVGNEDGSSTSISSYMYAASYGKLADNYSSETLNGAPWAATLNSKKTFDGNNKTIIYQYTGNQHLDGSDGSTLFTRTAYWENNNEWKIRGNVIGVNEGKIVNLKLAVVATSNNSVFYTSTGYTAYGIIAAINKGTIENCSVTISGGGNIGLTPISGTTSSTRVALGAIAGLSSGDIKNCSVKIVNNTTFGIIQSTNTNYFNSSAYVWVGGLVGVQNGRLDGSSNPITEVSNVAIIGKGNVVADYDNSHNYNAFVGGIGGYIFISNPRSITAAGVVINRVKLYNITVALAGQIRSCTTGTDNGGSGYIAGKALSFNTPQESAIDTAIASIDLGAVLVLGTGNVSVVDAKYANVQNTLLGRISSSDYNAATPITNTWTDIDYVELVSLEDYSLTGRGAASFVSAFTITANYYYPNNYTGYKVVDNTTISTTGFIVNLEESGTTSNYLSVDSLTVNASNGVTSDSDNDVINITGHNNPTDDSTSVANLTTSNGTTTASVTSVSSTQANPWIELFFKYDVNASTSEQLVNFIEGYGINYLQAGARKITLTSNIAITYAMGANRVLFEGRIIDGSSNNYKITLGGAYGSNLSGVSLVDATLYEYDTSDYYYGVSDFISINYGTIKNVVFEYSQNRVYTGINGSAAYGAVVGINALSGRIENCELILNNQTEYTLYGSANYAIVGGAVGINAGIINGLYVDINKNFEIKGAAKTLVVAGGVGINANGAELRNLEVSNDVTTSNEAIVINENFAVTTGGSVVFAGLVGINAGGLLKYATLRGEGAFKVGGYTVEEHVIDENTAEVEYIYTYKLGSNIPLYQAMGIGLSNNTSAVMTQPNVHQSIYSCVDQSGENNVDHIIIDYNGNVDASAAIYKSGLVFAVASTSSTAATDGVRYGNIFWNSDYSSGVSLANANTQAGQGLRFNGLVSGSSLTVMGWVDSGDGSFMTGAQIVTNAADTKLYWEQYNSDYVLAAHSNDITMTSLSAFESQYLSTNLDSQYNFLSDTYSNSNYYVTNVTSNRTEQEGTYVYMKELLTDMLSTKNTPYTGNAIRVEITYYYPYVLINNVFQLYQYMWYSSESSITDVINSEYLSAIEQVIDASVGAATETDRPSGLYVKLSDTDPNASAKLNANTLSGGTAQENVDYISYSYNNNNYAVFLLVNLDSNVAVGNAARRMYYYSASSARLGSDIVLNKYENVTVNLGFDSVNGKELKESKELSGKDPTTLLNHSIEIVADYVDSGNMSQFEYTDLKNAATPAKGADKVALLGGFMGRLSGILRNIDFVYSGVISQEVWYGESLFLGIIAGYSTGVIDQCSVTMSDVSQFYVYRRDNGNGGGSNMGHASNESYHTTICLGGYVGVLGSYGVISNSTFTMGYDSVLGSNSRGTTSWGPGGTLFSYIGGFVGTMTNASSMYNLVLQGEVSSLIFGVFATDANDCFNAAQCSAGGIVGLNTTDGDWNPHGWGKGSIDGVIFNWRGTSLTMIWKGKGWFGSDFAGNRKNIDVYLYGGASLGIVDNDSVDNLYYTFNVSSYAIDVSQYLTNTTGEDSKFFILNRNDSTGRSELVNAPTDKYYPYISYYTAQGVRVENVNQNNLSQYKVYRNYAINTNWSGGNAFHLDLTAAISFYDVLKNQNVATAKVFMVYGFNPPSNATVTGTGIDYTKVGSATVDGERESYTIQSGSFTVNNNYYTNLTKLGNILSWRDTNKSSPINVNFSVETNDASTVIWDILIYGAKSEGKQLTNSTGEGVADIPVYKIATSLSDAERYKTMAFTIVRGHGNGMALYYCTGSIAILSPNRDYYANTDNTNNPTIYNPLKAIMYDGQSGAGNVTISIYESSGQALGRISDQTKRNIYTQAQTNGYIKTLIVNSADPLTPIAADSADVTNIGNYTITYKIYSNALNNNAFVDVNNRIQFFNMNGETADTTDTTLDNGGNTCYLVDTYVVNVIIAPVSVYVNSVHKRFDESRDYIYTPQGGSANYSTIEGVLDTRFTYMATTGTELISTNDGGLALSVAGQTGPKYVPTSSSKYASEYINTLTDSSQSISLATESSSSNGFTFTIYEKNENSDTYKRITINECYLKSSDNTKYFTLSNVMPDTATLSNGVYNYTATFANSYTLNNHTAIAGNHLTALQTAAAAADTTLSAEDGFIKVYISEAKAPVIGMSSFELTPVYYTGSAATIPLETIISNLTFYDTDLRSYISLSTIRGTNNQDLTVTASFKQGEDGIDVVQGGYVLDITVTYTGNRYARATQSFNNNVTIYVIPVELTVNKMIKQYGTQSPVTIAVSTTVAGQAYSATTTTDTVTILGNVINLSLAYANENVQNAGNITVTGYNNGLVDILGNGSSQYIVGTNFYIASSTIIGAGVIYPKAATYVKASKTYDSNDAHILVAESSLNTTPLDVTPSFSFATNNVGQDLSVLVTGYRWEYVDESNVTHAFYTLSNSSGTVGYNYAIDSESSLSGSTADVTFTNAGWILPKAMTITSIYKVYDGNATFNNATFVISDLASVDGSFSSAYVNTAYKTTAGTYNDLVLTVSAYSGYTVVTGSGSNAAESQPSTTLYRAVSSSSATNYYIDEGTVSGSNCTITGKGVIVPKEVTITSVSKEYDGKTSYTNLTTLISGGINCSAIITSGTMSGSNANADANKYSVTVEYTTFTYTSSSGQVSCYWLYNSHNNAAENCYCVSNPTTTNVGKVTSKIINAGTGTGYLHNFYFKPSSGANVTFNNSGNATTTYTYGQKYNANNFYATFTWNGQDYELKYTNNSLALTVDNSAMTFSLTCAGYAQGAENASTSAYVYTLRMTSTHNDTDNFTFDGDQTLKLTINKRTLTRNDVTVSASGTFSKEYDGTSTLAADQVKLTIRAKVGSDTSIIASNLIGSVVSTAVNAGTTTVAVSYDLRNITNATNYQFTSSQVVSTSVSSTINPKNVTIENDPSFTKAFDGTSSGLVYASGIEGETLVLSYTPMATLKTLPGLYEDVTPESMAVDSVFIDESVQGVNTTSIAANYTITTGQFTLEITGAKVFAERQYVSSNQFGIALGLTGLNGFEFLKEYNSSLTDAQIEALYEDSVSSSALVNLKDTIVNMFVMQYNKSAIELLNIDYIESVRVVKNAIEVGTEEYIYTYSIEAIIYGHELLDTQTATDRYTVYLRTYAYNESTMVYTLDVNEVGSNIAVSSSELADGQYSGTYTTTGTAISTAAGLLEFLEDTTIASGYLTANIYGFDASYLTVNAFNRTLNGNGYSIYLTGGFNENSGETKTSGAYFIYSIGNSANISNVNFKFMSDVEIPVTYTSVGIITHTNAGTFTNVSLEMARELSFGAATETVPLGFAGSIGGFANTSSGTLTNVTITYASDITYTSFAGIAYTITAGTVNYVSLRSNSNAATINGYTVAYDSDVTIAYAINAISQQSTKLGDGTITRIYGETSGYGALSFFANGHGTGYLDYYFTTSAKYKNGNTYHDEVDDIESEANKSYYYKSSEAGTVVAIEVIAQLDKFIWEAFTAYARVPASGSAYLASLNRAVGLFAMSTNLSEVDIDFNTERLDSNRNAVSIFNPILGAKATIKISSDVKTIQEREYNGEQQTATFSGESTEGNVTVRISGTDVGVYTKYYTAAAGTGDSDISGFDDESYLAQTISQDSSSSRGNQTIMLIIFPKTLKDVPGNDNDYAVETTKEYDSTTIAETTFASENVFAVGSYDSASVGTEKTIEYKSNVKSVKAIETSNGVYSFISYRLVELTSVERNNVTVVIPTYRLYFIPYGSGNSATRFTSNTAISNTSDYAEAYHLLMTDEVYNDLMTKANAETPTVYLEYADGVTTNVITSVNVYDLIFTYTKGNGNLITYTNNGAIYYNTTLYNVPVSRAAAITKSINYNYLVFNSVDTEYTEFEGLSIVASSATPVMLTATDEGVITGREISGYYSGNLNQSYNATELVAPEVSLNNTLSNADKALLPHTMTNAQITAFETEMASISVEGSLSGATGLTYNSTTGKYTATNKQFAHIVLPARQIVPEGTEENNYVESNYIVNVAASSINDNTTLVLRWFIYNSTLNAYEINTFADLLAIGLSENDNEYATLDYVITRTLNGRGQVVESMNWTANNADVPFSGTIDGQNNIIRNFVLVGTTSTGLFKSISASAEISNIKILNVMALINGENTSVVSIISTSNLGDIDNITIEGEVVSEAAFTLDAVANGGNVTNALVVLQGNSITEENATVTEELGATNNITVIFREYGYKFTINDDLSSILTVYVNGTPNSGYTGVTASAEAVIKQGMANAPISVNAQNKVTVRNFREYWAWINICPFFDNASQDGLYIGKGFEEA